MQAKDEWKEAQEWERNWHGDCANSLNEELKQLVYARKMGIVFTHDGKSPYNILLNDKAILDIGGGAYSLLLKASGFSEAMVIDPCKFPDWVYKRYDALGISYTVMPAEEMVFDRWFDEVWIYNCLQHVISPPGIIKRALGYAKIVRVFEWMNIGISAGHLHNLTPEKMDEWLGGRGKTEMLNESGCVGQAYYGIFKGNLYGK
jgi:hypothetical protein